MEQIKPLLLRQKSLRRCASDFERWQLFDEPFPDRLLAKVAEGRIPDIVNQAGALEDRRYFTAHRFGKLRVKALGNDGCPDILRKGPAYGRNLE